MSALFPHAEYAEDQPLARTILTTHVLHRGFQSGATGGILVGAVHSVLLLPLRRSHPVSQSRAVDPWTAAPPPPPRAAPFSATLAPVRSSFNALTAAASPSTTSHPTPSRLSYREVTTTAARTVAKRSPPLLHAIERPAGVGAVLGTAAMAVMLPYYMHSRDGVEWQDRSWRLLANQGQVEVDWWSLGGAAGGVMMGLVERVGRGGVGGGELNWRSVVGRAGVGSMLGVVGYIGWRYGVMKGERGGNHR